MRLVCQTPIAILLATYNAEKYLKEQIDSLLLQTCQQWTLFIRDDGSTDATQVIIDDYLSSYPNKIVQIDKGDPNLGCSGNFLRLLEVVDATYYMFCDQDDIWLPEKISICYKVIKEKEFQYHSMPLLVHSDSLICDMNMKVIQNSIWGGKDVDKLSTYNDIAVCNTVAGATACFINIAKRVSLQLYVEGSRLLYDHWIAMCVAKYGRIFFIQQSLRMYRQHENQVLGLNKNDTILKKLYNLKSIVSHWLYDANILGFVGYRPICRYFFFKIVSIIKHRLA